MTDEAPRLDDPATDPFAVASAAATAIKERTGVERHDVAVVLGSGWASAAESIGTVVAAFDQTVVPGFGPAVVPGQDATVRSVALGDGYRALVLGTRAHLYEGRGVRSVAHPVRTAAAAGCRVVVLTNGSGGLNPAWPAGTPVLVADHLNLTGASPLEGPTFLDLTDLYSARLRATARGVDPDLPDGVYAQFRGPHYETPAEVRMVRTLGADLVGMSTALEAIAARQAGLDVLALSLVTNPAAGVTPQPLSHDDVLQAGRAAAPRCTRLLAGILPRVVAH